MGIAARACVWAAARNLPEEAREPKAGFNLPQSKRQASQQGFLSDKTTHFGLDCAVDCPRKWYQYAAIFTISDKRVNYSRRAAARSRAIPSRDHGALPIMLGTATKGRLR